MTGAGKGIGRACALELARQGTAVIVNNRRKETDASPSADMVVNEIRAMGGQAISNYQSIEHKDAANLMVGQALDHFGQLDVVINNAGIGLNKLLGKTSQAELREVMEINFFAAAALTQAALPALQTSASGRMVYCISSAGLHSGFGLAAYAASKAALWAYMRACALENTKTGLCVNALAPFADTQMSKGFMDDATQLRLTPEAIAPLVAWLASEDCDVTSETFVTAGGRVRIARTGETDSATFADIQQAAVAVKKIKQGPFDNYFTGASDAFIDIVNK